MEETSEVASAEACRTDDPRILAAVDHRLKHGEAVSISNCMKLAEFTPEEASNETLKALVRSLWKESNSDDGKVAAPVRETWSERKKKLHHLVRDWASESEFAADEADQMEFYFYEKSWSELWDDLNPEDGLVLFVILWTLDFFECFDGRWLIIDEGRIVQMKLCDGVDYLPPRTGLPIKDPFDLPPIIGKLSHLKGLELTNCKSIPKEMENLRFLDTITLRWCPAELNDGIPPMTRLENLKRLVIEGPDRKQRECIESNAESLRHLLNPPHLAWQSFRLPSLKCLFFWNLLHSASDEVLQNLKQSDIEYDFCHSLKELLFYDCQLIETSGDEINGEEINGEEINGEELNRNQVADLLLDVIPRFPNVCELDLDGNFIYDLQPTADRIVEQQKLGLVSKYRNNSLCFLNLDDDYGLPTALAMATIIDLHPLLDESEKDIAQLRKQEKGAKINAALLTVLDTFQGIAQIAQERPPLFYEPEVEQRLRINKAGRKHMRSDINVALWPRILERAYENSPAFYSSPMFVKEGVKSHECATGVFHLLRHGPLFTSDYWLNRKRRKIFVSEHWLNRKRQKK